MNLTWCDWSASYDSRLHRMAQVVPCRLPMGSKARPSDQELGHHCPGVQPQPAVEEIVSVLNGCLSVNTSSARLMYDSTENKTYI